MPAIYTVGSRSGGNPTDGFPYANFLLYPRGPSRMHACDDDTSRPDRQRVIEEGLVGVALVRG